MRGQAKAHKGVGKFSEILGFLISDILREIEDLKELRSLEDELVDLIDYLKKFTSNSLEELLEVEEHQERRRMVS